MPRTTHNLPQKTCECGCVVAQKHYARHKTTRKHARRMATQSPPPLELVRSSNEPPEWGDFFVGADAWDFDDVNPLRG